MRPTALRLLLALLLLVHVVPLGWRPLSIPDEGRYAEISREMVQTGDWVVPRLLALRYFEKPDGGYWLENLSQLAFGANNFAVRLPSALAACISGLLVLLLARMGTGDSRKSLLAATIYLSSLVAFGMQTAALLDAMLSMWLTAGLVAFWRAFSAASARARACWWSLFGAACGAAFLTKGFVGLAVPVVVIVPFMLWQRRWRELIGYGCLSVLAASLVALPWALAIDAREGDYWSFFFWEQHIRRFFSADAQHPFPFWFFLPILALMALPWTGAAGSALARSWRAAVRAADPFHRFLLLAVVMPLLFFSASRGKLATYILPCWAPLSVVLAHGIAECLDRGRARAVRAAAVTQIVIAAGGLIAIAGARVFLAGNRFVAGEAGTELAMAAFLLLWIVLALASLRGRLRLEVGLASMLLGAALLGPFALPRYLRFSRMPQRVVAAEAARLRDRDVALASASVRLSPLLAWEFHRSDVTIVGDKSELEYGLSYDDAAGRFLRNSEFAGWLSAERRRRPVVLFSFWPPEKPFDAYPEPDRLERDGPLCIAYYDSRAVTERAANAIDVGIRTDH